MNIQDVIRNPKFLSLPDQEKQKVLISLSPEFASLPGGEQLKVVASLGAGGTPEPSPSGPPALLGETTLMEPMPPPRGMLPVAGQLGAGGATLATTGNPMAAYMAGVAGAGAGSAIEDYLWGTPEGKMERAIWSMIGAGIAPGPGAAAGAVTKMTPEAINAVEFAVKNRLPIDAAEASPSFITRLLSGDVFAAGRYKTEQYARRANEFLINFRSKLLSDFTGASDTAGIPLAAIPGKVKPELKALTTEAYQVPLDIVKETTGSEQALIRVENMRRTAGQMLHDSRIQRMGPAKAKGRKLASPKEWLEDFLHTESKDGSIPFDRAHKINSEINRVFYGAGEEGGAPLLKAFADDLVAWDAEVGLKINEAYAIARGRFQSSMARGRFDTIYSILRKSTKVDRETGAEILNGQILKDAIRSPAGKTGQTVEQKILELYGEKEGRMILDDLYATADYAIHTQKLRAKQGMEIWGDKAILSAGGSAGASFIPGMPGGVVGSVAVPQGTSLALTYLLASPGKAGILRKLFTYQGFPGLRIGSKAGFQYMVEQAKPERLGATPPSLGEK